MGNQIRVLPPEVADKIAAGEVAERPASVVKELVENAIDAGADKITIEIEKGGVKLIRITDNGNGIPKEQVPTAFLRHATSKLSAAEDLYSIRTMGFRGEALSSICAVARVEVITKTRTDEAGIHYVVDHGVCGEPDEIACGSGTIMEVRDLFANIPARMKFLKKDSTETGYISDLITRLALSRPDISFDYYIDGKQMFRTVGDGDIANVVLKTYGLKFAKSLTPICYGEEGIEVTGVLGKPELSFGNRTKQTILVNGRYIKSPAISKVAEEAFRNAVMVGRFPFFVIKIDMPPELVDVNVHPAKTEVKFANEKQLYNIIYHAIKNAMYGTKPGGDVNKSDSPSQKFPEAGKTNKMEDPVKITKEVVQNYLEYTTPKNNTEYEQNGKPSVNESLNDIIDDFLEMGGEKKPAEKPEEKPAEQEEGVQLKMETEPAAAADYSDNPEERGAGENLFKDYKVIGQVFNTYVIVSDRDNMYMIDQHAAHERSIFEELKQAYFKGERMSQLLLSPVVIDLTHEEFDAAISGIEEFKKFGFEIAEFGGNTVVVNETPVVVDEQGIKDLFYEILNALIDNRKHPIADFEEKALDMISCKKAIKGNDVLSLREMTQVVNLVGELAAKGITTCPHGRPIVVKQSKRDIEKMFKRIV